MKRPLGVTLISYFYIFGALVLLFTAIFYQAEAEPISIAERFGIPNAPEKIVRATVALFSGGMIYGYMRLKKWGFWLMVTYSMLFGVISLLLITDQAPQPYTGNFVWSMIVLIYTVNVREAFFKRNFHY
ncbi:hypothetical protein [Thalassobacillus devorans]|uniref:hypothetical protein n=1 Tax=Thalassobacillus devorans TaxID=279813 RepID=UPI000A1CC1B1|nr:hypothetical protein [Thalassobacillus devorans]